MATYSRLSGLPAVLFAVLATSLLLISAARAGETQAFLDRLQSAYPHYRTAAFYTRTENYALARGELADFQKAWQAIADQYGSAPPEMFSGDSKWADTFKGVGGHIAAALSHIAKKDKTRALAALNAIATDLSALRRRSHVETFSDCYLEIRDAVEGLRGYRAAPPDFDDPASAAEALGQVAVIEYLFRRCEMRAPAAYPDNDLFRFNFDGAHQSLARLRKAVLEKNRKLFFGSLSELSSFDRIIFMEFG